jgi:hypothetical protein
MKRDILILSEQVMTPTFQYIGSSYHIYCYGCMRTKRECGWRSFCSIHDQPAPSMYSLGGSKCGDRRCKECDQKERGRFLELMKDEVRQPYPKWSEATIAGLF